MTLETESTPQLQQDLLSARRTIDSQATQILSLEAALLSRPPLPADAPSSEKDALIAEQAKTIRELEVVVAGYEENLGEPLRQVREDVEREWEGRVGGERRRREESEVWARELERELEREKGVSFFFIFFIFIFIFIHVVVVSLYTLTKLTTHSSGKSWKKSDGR